tara:strand:+ start:4886 stop:5089 length:204 start_codon:yes stop_codon:yes gene_type:complete
MKDKFYNNADSFSMAFDDEWKKFKLEDNNLKIKKILKKLSEHPFVRSNPKIAADIANFRINSLGKFN